MKWITIFNLLLLVALDVCAQRTKIFSLSPMSRETDKVNGVVLGLGHIDDVAGLQRVNGLNIDLMVLSPLAMLYMDPKKHEVEEVKLISHGVNIGVGGFSSRAVVHRGFSMAMYSMGQELSGVGLHVAYTSAPKINGLHISGIGNYSGSANGVQIAINNESVVMRGLQIGLFNSAARAAGVQIGLFNRSERLSGAQFGIWNTNGKRSLPFINF